jgi:hypothetical protein
MRISLSARWVSEYRLYAVFPVPVVGEVLAVCGLPSMEGHVSFNSLPNNYRETGLGTEVRSKLEFIIGRLLPLALQ